MDRDGKGFWQCVWTPVEWPDLTPEPAALHDVCNADLCEKIADK